jgi:AcrR family transcriptional regulator
MPVNKHQQRTEATRRKLLNAALRVFSRDGFEAARIEDIAAESGHTRGAFYANFDSKEDLFFAILEKQSSERLLDLRRRLQRCGSLPGRIRVLRAFYLERARDRQSMLLTLEFKLFALRHPKMRARLALAHRRIRASLKYEALAKLLPSHQNGKQNEVDKVLLEVVLVGLVLEHAYDPRRISAKQTAETLGSAFDLLITEKLAKPERPGSAHARTTHTKAGKAAS